MRLFLRPFDDLRDAFLRQLVEPGRPKRAMLAFAVALAATWWIYVPVHEMLHVLGCIAVGGKVSELQVAPEYGGRLLARIFPFVQAGGDYPGRLSGFDTGGSDFVYLVTDFAPYLLTVLVGVPLLRRARTRPMPALFGAAFVLATAPLLNIPGDYYEMGSIVVTRLAAILGGNGELTYANLRSDDVVKLVDQLWSSPAGAVPPMEGALVALALVTGALMAVATHWMGLGMAALVNAAHSRQ